MASCERCWDDAYLRMMSSHTKSQTEHYMDLMDERKDDPCTLEQQAGNNTDVCPECNRKTIHRILNICINCGYKNDKSCV